MPAIGKTRRQVRQCALFLMQIENIKSVNKLLTESVEGFRVLEIASNGGGGGFELQPKIK